MVRITRFALDHRAITYLMAVVLLVLGASSAVRLNQELVPPVDFPVATVVVVWPGASADEVTREVIVPLEGAFENLGDVRVAEVTSNASESFGAVTVNAEVGTPSDELRAAVEKALADVDLPEGALDPDVVQFSFSDIPLLQASASGDMPLNELQKLVEAKVVPELEAIDGVSRVSVAGGSEDRLYLTLDPDAMQEAGVTLDQMQGVLKANNLSFPAGTMTDKDRTFPVVVSHRVTTIEEMEDLVIKPAGMPAGSMGGMAGAGAMGGGAMPGMGGGAPGGAPPGGMAGPSAGAPTGGMPGAPGGAAPGGMPGAAPGGAPPAAGAPSGQSGPPAGAPPSAGQPPSGGQASAGSAISVDEVPDEDATLADLGFGPTPPLTGTLPLPAEFAEFGFETTADITGDAVRALEEADEDSLRSLALTLLEALPPGGASLLRLDAVSALPDDLQSQVFALAAAPAAPATAWGAATRPTAAASPSAAPPSSTPTRAPTPAPTAAPVTLGDVAKVSIAPAESSVFNRTNGEASLGLIVIKDRDANTVVVSDAVQARLDEFAATDDFKDIKFITAFAQAPFVKESIQGVVREGILGGVFAIVVIFLFLTSVRSTLVVAVSIPLSVMTGFLLMNLQGLTLNMLTLGGITVAIGRVVDDAIVVLENIFRHLHQGESRRQAILSGTSEVSTAIAASTLVAVAVFLPLGLVGGITRQFFLPMALAITYALAASLLVAVTVVPTLAQQFMRPAEEPDTREPFLVRLYMPVLRLVLDHRILTVILAAVFFVGSLTLISVIPVTFLPDFGDPSVSVSVALPPGTPLNVTDKVAGAVERKIKEHSEVETVQATVGLANPAAAFFGEISGGDAATAFVQAAFSEDYDGDTDALAADLRKELDGLSASDLGTTEPVTFTVSSGAGGGPQSKTFDLVLSSDSEVDLREANILALAALMDKDNWVAPETDDEETGLRARMQKMQSGPAFKGVPFVNLKSNLSEAREVVAVEVDPAKALGKGLTTVQVAAALREALEGREMGSVEMETDGGTETLKMEARWPDDVVTSMARLKEWEVPGPAGPVPLEEIAKVSAAPGAVQITRVDGARSAILQGEITEENTIGVQRKAQELVENLDGMPESVSVATGAQAAQQQEAFADMLTALGVAVLISYLVMVMTFGSLVHPFTILLSLPFSLSGALVALAVTGRALSISSLIGLLMLIGIALANAIVLLDIVQQYREKGMSTRDAVLTGGRVRLRPILMTALATVLGLVPLALGLTEGAIIASELATVVIGGLVSATLLTLIIVPVMYSLLDGIANRGAGGPSDELTPAAAPPS